MLKSTVKILLIAWGSTITAFATAATTGHTPTELAATLDRLGDASSWAALAAALRRVLAGDRERLVSGLDDVDTAILTAVFDQLSTNPGQDL